MTAESKPEPDSVPTRIVTPEQLSHGIAVMGHKGTIIHLPMIVIQRLPDGNYLVHDSAFGDPRIIEPRYKRSQP